MWAYSLCHFNRLILFVATVHRNEYLICALMLAAGDISLDYVNLPEMSLCFYVYIIYNYLLSLLALTLDQMYCILGTDICKGLLIYSKINKSRLIIHFIRGKFSLTDFNALYALRTFIAKFDKRECNKKELDECSN